MAPGVRWFHSGGIFASLSETTGPLIIEAMKAAKAAGAVTSFDLNFRQKLWDIWGGQKKALSVMKGIVEHVDVLVGNEEDLQKGLGLKGPDVTAKSKLDPRVFFGMIDSVVKHFPNVKVVATTLREVHSTNRHSWGAVAWIDGKTYTSPTCELDVYDRVGGGRWFRLGPFLRPAHRRITAGIRQSWLGSRRVADHLSRRHDHGHVGPGQILCQRRFGPHPALKPAARRTWRPLFLRALTLRSRNEVVIIFAILNF